MNLPVLMPRSFINKQGLLPKQIGPKIDITVAVPGLKNFSDLCTLLAPFPPPLTCCEYKGRTMYLLGPTHKTKSSCKGVVSDWKVDEQTATYLGLHRFRVLSVPLDNEMQDRLLVLVPQKTMYDEGNTSFPVLND